MNRACLDVRIWGPLVVAGAALLLRGAPVVAPPPATTARAIELPALHAAAEPSGDVDYVLDAGRSSVRLLRGADGPEHLAACPGIRGRMRLRDGGSSRELELDLDLGSLAAVGDRPATADPWQQLGLPRDGALVYRATLQRSATSNLPGVTERVWLGTLRGGGTVAQQSMALWQVSLPGQPLRLQGLTTLAGGVTLGLDLAFRRQRGN